MQTVSTAPAAAPMSARVPALQVEGLGVRYGALVALDDVGWA
ncbi:MAG: ABC transporter ATP-binding protein, partial [Microbacteriaceae bacterium]|nr:ABC transporter ATP-binding protein [Burkholderiaceae bacterium]